VPDSARVREEATRAETVGYQARENGVLSYAEPKRLQALCDGLSGEKIEALLRKWLPLLPRLFAAKDRQAGYRYQLSTLQIELPSRGCSTAR